MNIRENEIYKEEENHKIIEAMNIYGGSFVKTLAQAFWNADPINFKKLKDAFPEYWDRYKKMI